MLVHVRQGFRRVKAHFGIFGCQSLRQHGNRFLPDRLQSHERPKREDQRRRQERAYGDERSSDAESLNEEWSRGRAECESAHR
jgi:hypothetical protein